MKATHSIKDRFKYLRNLKLGWFYADTPVLNQKGIEELEDWYLNHYDFEGLPMPRIYPTPMCGVQFEVQLDSNKVIEVVVDLDTLVGELSVIGDDVETETILLKSVDGWRRFNDVVKHGF